MWWWSCWIWDAQCESAGENVIFFWWCWMESRLLLWYLLTQTNRCCRWQRPCQANPAIDYWRAPWWWHRQTESPDRLIQKDLSKDTTLLLRYHHSSDLIFPSSGDLFTGRLVFPVYNTFKNFYTTWHTSSITVCTRSPGSSSLRVLPSPS